jgi:hypothetical protein
VIAHHASTAAIAIELGIIAVIVALLALVTWRGKRGRGRPRDEIRDRSAVDDESGVEED